MTDFVVDSDPEDGLLHMFSPLSGPSASTRHPSPPCAKRQRGSDSAGAACAASSATAAASGGAHSAHGAPSRDEEKENHVGGKQQPTVAADSDSATSFTSSASPAELRIGDTVDVASRTQPNVNKL